MRTTTRTLLHLLVVAVVALATGVVLPGGLVSAESNGGVRVMPPGDSITEGTQVPGGYRTGLWHRFGAGGYRVDFVGSQFNGPTGLGDHDHEGHPGWRIDQIDAHIVPWSRGTDPRTVLLHVGTNDVLRNHNLAGAPARLSALVDHVTATVPTADLVDGIHPTAAGYDKMAAAWLAALRAVPGSIGDPDGPPGMRVVGAQSGRRVDVPGGTTAIGTQANQGTANGTKLILWSCNGQANQRWTLR